ncbi:hypothetical protein [Pseudonocardia abyssalis]|uniref:Uncharacterized protein n=1 Tax=Pseudonocardia abyssalis TaxID=2792008 RepID=A0ABS6V1C9_9PSEU|nr:hypothetical protein [Pseudonocardia abyssalis]MBW0117576.1 hypothetical protein [Pseudonocardia abyssalis]MBW0137774.1 hypothetical protein [Pseudonocardia abyssalis]
MSSAAHARAVQASSAGAVLAAAFGVTVLAAADGSARGAVLVLASCLATFAVPVAVRVWGGRAPDADALFVRVLVSVSGYLLPMAVFQAQFGP